MSPPSERPVYLAAASQSSSSGLKYNNRSSEQSISRFENYLANKPSNLTRNNRTTYEILPAKHNCQKILFQDSGKNINTMRRDHNKDATLNSS